MSSDTLAEAQTTLAMYKAARKRVAESGETVSVGDKSYSTANLRDLEDMVDKYAREVSQMTAAAAGVDPRLKAVLWASRW